MLRRRLFAYAVMFTLGVASGYLFFECNKYLPAVAMMMGVALVARSIDLEYKPNKTEEERKILIAAIIIGFAVFTSSYITINGVIRDENNNRIQIDDTASITGHLTSITEKQSESGSYYQILIQPESISCHGKIQLNYYQEIDGDYIDMLGRNVTLYGELRRPAGVENPGCFNYRSYLYSRGIRYTYSCKYMKLCADDKNIYWRYKRKLLHIREQFIQQFSEESF